MEIVAGFVFGFAGSLHCIGMCGPIILALPVGERSVSQFTISRFVYHFGRVLTYALMGIMAGMLGGRILFPVFQQNLSIVAGGVIILSLIVRRLRGRVTPRIPGLARLGQELQRAIADLLRERSLPSMFALGMANGLLPCGFVYVAMTAAAVTADPLGGSIFMVGFGLGTVPAMVGFSFFPRLASAQLRTRINAVLPAFTLLVGVLLILRGLNLGIPFVSPKLVPGSSAPMIHNHH
jgi:sulfite exporter TauE/SafE